MPVDLLRALFGIACLIGLCALLSEKRKAINWRLVAGGMTLQLLLALLFLVVPGGSQAFSALASFFVWITGFSREGAMFVFGPLADPAAQRGLGFIFAFQVLPTIIFFSALCSLLYYWGVLQRVVWAFAWVTRRFMKLSGAESLAAAASVFLGQTESPLMVKPYVAKMTRSEIFALMTSGMGTIAGGVLVAYIMILGGTDPVQQQAFAKFLLCASFMAAPASLVVAKILVPETGTPDASLSVPRDRLGANFLDALANGTSDGLKLALNVGAMLIAFIAFAALVNAGLSMIHPTLTLDWLLGWIFSPFAWLIGVPGADIREIGSLLGSKVVFNEFVAYTQLGELKAAGLADPAVALDPKSIFLATFALCGFANFSSIGIQLGGTGSLAPNQRPTLAALGFKAVLGGTVTTLITATLAGALYPWVG
jgi:CNT family concentrative nucleoside transporter